MSAFLQAACRIGFIERNIAAGYKCLIHTLHQEHISAAVNNGKDHRHVHFKGFRLNGSSHFFRSRQRDSGDVFDLIHNLSC
nr:MAG TPA: hypothetical protein [Caudoviricetes sp.]